MANDLQMEMGRLIGSILLSGESLTLPDVGTLYLVHTPSRRLSSSQVLPPRRTVDFSSNIGGLSLVAELKRELQCSDEQALEVYSRWLSQSRLGDVVTILGVGELRQKSFVMEKSFSAKLNPQGATPVEVAQIHRMPWWEWSLLSIVVVALVVVATLWFVSPEIFSTDSAQEVEEFAEQPLQTQPAQLAVEPNDTLDVAVATSQPETLQSSQTQDITQEVAQPMSSESKPEEPQQPEAKQSGVILPTESGVSYVVLGIYSTEANSRRAIAQAVKRYSLSEGECSLYRYGSKYLVSLSEETSRQAAQDIASRYRREVGIKDVWVYTKK